MPIPAKTLDGWPSAICGVMASIHSDWQPSGKIRVILWRRSTGSSAKLRLSAHGGGLVEDREVDVTSLWQNGKPWSSSIKGPQRENRFPGP